jgi:hypothetical protein
MIILLLWLWPNYVHRLKSRITAPGASSLYCCAELVRLTGDPKTIVAPVTAEYIGQTVEKMFNPLNRR